MMLLNFFLKLFVIFLFLTSSSYADEILDLGASEIQGEVAQPGTLTFIRRAPLAESGTVIKFNGKEKIKEEIKTSRLFDLVY